MVSIKMVLALTQININCSLTCLIACVQTTNPSALHKYIIFQPPESMEPAQQEAEIETVDSPDEGGGVEANEEAVPEKLQDDDAMKDLLWERVLYGIFPMLRRGWLGVLYQQFLLSLHVCSCPLKFLFFSPSICS